MRSSGIGPASWPSPRGVISRNLVPSKALGLDRGLGAVAEVDVVVDVELHQHLRAVQRDARTLCPTSISRNLHGRTGGQAAGLGEVGRVVLSGLTNGSLS